MSEHIDHKQALANLIPNGDGYNSDYAVTLAGAVEHIEHIEQQRDELAKALRSLVGCLEIASVLPDAIGKVYVPRMHDPELERARAALAKVRGEG